MAEPTGTALVEMQRAVVDGLRARATYRSRSAPASERILDPVGLVYAADHWYLLALRDGVERTYRVSRFEAVTVLAEPARRPATVDLEASFLASTASFHRSLPRITVTCLVRSTQWDEVSRKALRVLEHTAEDDGWIRAQLEFTEPAHALGVLWAAGPDAVAIAPQEIRETLSVKAAATAAAYR